MRLGAWDDEDSMGRARCVHSVHSVHYVHSVYEGGHAPHISPGTQILLAATISAPWGNGRGWAAFVKKAMPL